MELLHLLCRFICTHLDAFLTQLLQFLFQPLHLVPFPFSFLPLRKLCVQTLVLLMQCTCR